MTSVTYSEIQPEPATAVNLESHLAVGALLKLQRRPVVRGKFLYVGDEKLWVKGVTYGTFRPTQEGSEYGTPALVEQDFAAMVKSGINTVRTYTMPPRWLLDSAWHHGLWVIIGLPWEQHITFLDGPGRAQAIEQRVRGYVNTCAAHPAVLCYVIGNEIPASIVRWHGRKHIEKFLRRLYQVVKEEDPTALVTYVNYPTTEYLQLPCVDLVCFNVYLESRERLEAYLARLHNLTDDRPLLLAEIGLDSCRHGREQQAETLDWQIRTVFAGGACGAVVFAWTDAWYRGGYDIEDWDFGLTTRDRLPKPALATVHRAFIEVPFSVKGPWPRISVVVCSYNGARTLRDTLAALAQLDYPDYEVIVVNDGSTDATPAIAADYAVRLISIANRGLSSARNTGWQAATSEIVAYIDDDAYPDPHWLTYLAATFRSTDYVGVGGPNLAPPGDGPVADCIANAPGGPVHVLVSDREAEHIPGCNMAFRRAALEAIGGFDPRYRTAGDDVDICWRLQENGGTLGFHPAALVWHHRRNSVKMYWKQQQGYGKAEALLEEKWPERYNVAGHLAWAGRLYGKGLTQPLRLARWRIYQGTWGIAPFQSLYEPAPGTLLALPLMPEWYLIVLLLAGLSAVGLLWSPLLYTVPLLVLAVAALVIQAGISAAKATFTSKPTTFKKQLKLRSLTAFLHLLQPLARLIGRLKHGLTPWRRRGGNGLAMPRWRLSALWSESWQAPEVWLRSIQEQLRAQGAVTLAGGDYDRWDLTIRNGSFGFLRLRMAVEEHGAGRQLLKFRSWPQVSKLALSLFSLFAALAVGAFSAPARSAALLLAGAAVTIAAQAASSCASATRSWLDALARIGRKPPDPCR
jgi:GT2 family glycosyltransferase